MSILSCSFKIIDCIFISLKFHFDLSSVVVECSIPFFLRNSVVVVMQSFVQLADLLVTLTSIVVVFTTSFQPDRHCEIKKSALVIA
jgi:hypothetical protein